MINGRPHHPQTQGSVENANKTFKRRLTALQLETGRPASEWVVLLPQLASIINTSPSRALPRGKTPYDVWFGRRPHWIFEEHERVTQTGDNDDDNEAIDLDDEIDSDAEDVVLTRIEVEVAKNNARLHAQMKKGNSRAIVHEEQSIATLRIPPKNRLKTEAARLPVRILEYEHGQYKLQSQWGRLSGRYQGGELNSITEPSTAQIFGRLIPVEPEFNRGKEVVISLAMAVAKENNWGSIASL